MHMGDRQTGTKKWLYFGIICAVVWIIMFFLNYYTRPMYDDYWLAFFLTGERISSVKDVFLAFVEKIQKGYYSRAFSTLFAYFNMNMDHRLLSVINPSIFLLMCATLTYHGTGESPEKHLPEFLFVFCTIFLLTPRFAEDFLWIIGSAEYLTGPTIMLLFLTPYRAASSRCQDEAFAFKPLLEMLKFVGMFLLGFFAGATMESIALTLPLMILGFLLYYRTAGIRIRPWMLAPGFLFGGLFLFYYNGVFGRIQRNIGGKPFLLTTARNAVYLTGELMEFFWPLLLALLMIVAYYVHKQGSMRMTSETVCSAVRQIAVPLIYFVEAALTLYVMSPIAKSLGRVWIIPMYFFLPGLIQFYRQIIIPDFQSSRFFQKAVRLTACFLLLCTVVSSARGIFNVRSRAAEYDARTEYILRCKEAGMTRVPVPTIWSTSRYSVYRELGDLACFYERKETAEIIARYFGIDGEVYWDPSLDNR